ncbi:MAG TPA: MFS transporter [Candidatus Bathyarchaeia archaeon]|nr:MFS transporter [Candidatus Bathyarchaeia archaeon]
MTSKTVLYVVALNHAINDGSVYLPSTLFPIIISLFSLSVFQVGILVSAGYIVSVIFQPVVGHYSESRNPGKLLATGILVVSLSLLTFTTSNGFPALLFSIILLRLGSSFFHPVGISAVSRTYRGPGLQRAMGFQSAFGNVGVLLIFLSAAPVYTLIGWAYTWILYASLTMTDVILTILILRTKRSPVQLVNNHTVNQSPIGKYYVPFFTVAAAFVSGGSYAVILNFANILLKDKLQLSTPVTNLVVSAFIATASVGAFSTGTLAQYAKTNTSLSAAFLLASVAIFLVALFPGSLALATAGLLVCGFSISATYPLTYTILSDHIGRDPERTGRSFGILSSSQTIGGSVMGLLAGSISQLAGLSYAFVAVAIIMLVASFSAMLWTRTLVIVRFERPLAVGP